MRPADSSRSIILSARNFYLCLRNGLLPVSPEWTLPERRPGYIHIITPFEAHERIAQIPWYNDLRAVAPMGNDAYAAVFDYRWISEKTGPLRGHAIAMLLWDRIILIAMSHDPACECPECIRRRDG